MDNNDNSNNNARMSGSSSSSNSNTEFSIKEEPTARLSCWQSISRYYLVLLTAFSLFAGLSLLAMSFWSYNNFKDYRDPVINKVFIWGPLTFSLVVLSTSM